MTEVRDEAGEWLERLRRNSGLALDGEGRWRYGTGFVENERVVELFHRGVAVREDGEVTLTVGRMWAYVACEGPARFVRAVREERLSLLGGEEVALTPATVFGWGPDERLYVWIDAVTPAKVLRAPHQSLIAGLEVEGEALTLAIGQRRWPVVRLAAAPGPRTVAPGA